MLRKDCDRCTRMRGAATFVYPERLAYLKIALLQRRPVVGIFLTLLLLLQGTESVLAGTTGRISGVVIDSATHKPIAGARVTAASPSQSASTTTDASGHYAFLSLAPDTYTISVAGTGTFDALSVSGVTIQADQTLNEPLAQNETLKTIGKVSSRAASSLVKPGTTADVYSIGATQQDKASQVGGGGTLNSAWSALSTVPGVFVAPGQNGYIGAGSTAFATLSIRGGDYDQIGFEFDGIPINRSFDNYPSSQLSSLGQQEVQVYTGASSATAEASGLSGYVNQVIKTGSSPAFQALTLADGGPAFYHKASIEAGGANPAHTFSYYVGLGGYNQDFRYGDQFNAASVSSLWGTPIESCSSVPAANFSPSVVPTCFAPNGAAYNASGGAYVLGSIGNLESGGSTIASRDSVVNLHFGIPRKDGNKDDIQLLFDVNHLNSYGYSSPNDLGGANFLSAIGFGAPAYADGYQAAVPYGSLLPAGYTGGGGVVSPYLFPNTGLNRPFGGAIPANYRDANSNNQNIVKLQYQHNFGSNAYLRVYGYTYYSDWLMTGPNGNNQLYNSFTSNDYELSSHARGFSASFADQINDKNLLSIQGSYTTANAIRYNNSGIGNGLDTTVGYLVNGNDPYNGIAYNLVGGAVPGAQYNAAGLPFQNLTVGEVLNGTAAVPAPGVTCGGGPCRYEIVSGGPAATYNKVKPKFTSLAITDDFRPTSKLDINIGLKYDLFQFVGANTFNSGARTFFYNAYNSQAVANGDPVLAFDPTGAPSQNNYPEFEPRLGATYAFDPATVLRVSYGRYAQAPNTAFEQYDYLQPNDLSKLIGFGVNGLPTTPGHDVRPPVSNNYDFSIEHQFGGNTAVKLTPFMRKTQDQIQNFFLDQKTGFISGLNVGNQTSEGIELEVDKGDFSRNGFAAKASFAYTNSYIRYNRTPTGTSVVDPINGAIKQFNGYTKAGGGFPYYSLANATTGAAGVGSTTGGPGFVANPYYNAPLQGLLDPNANYPTFSTFPGGIGSVVNTISPPYVGTVLVQYKHGPLSVTPSLQYVGGLRYGIPENTPGIAPDQITGVLAGSTVGDPRYANFGSPGPGGSPYDSTTALTTIAIPDLYTNRFDALGAFIQPSSLQANLQVSYDLTKRVTIVGTLANLYSSYFGGSKPGWQVKGAQAYTTQCTVCGAIPPAGNVYNPGTPLQPYVASPYIPTYLGFPFGVYVEARVKL
jgi:hypothetical protein